MASPGAVRQFVSEDRTAGSSSGGDYSSAEESWGNHGVKEDEGGQQTSAKPTTAATDASAITTTTKLPESRDILERFQALMNDDPLQSVFGEGKRKALRQSRFRKLQSLSPEPSNSTTYGSPVKTATRKSVLTANTTTQILHDYLRPSPKETPAVTGSRRQLAAEPGIGEWLDYVSREAIAQRDRGQTSLPVLSKDSAYAALWGKKIVTASSTCNSEGSSLEALLAPIAPLASSNKR